MTIVIYMVDSLSTELTMEQLVCSQQSALETASRFTARGEHVRCLRSTYVSGESRCIYWLEASNPRTVEEVFEVAKVPFDRPCQIRNLSYLALLAFV